MHLCINASTRYNMRYMPAKSRAADLTPQEVEQVTLLMRGVGARRVAKAVGLDARTLRRALLGEPVHPGTALLVRAALERGIR